MGLTLNIVILILGCVAAWLLYYYRLRKAYSRRQVRPLILPFLLISLLLVLNGLAVYIGRPKLARFVETPLLSTVEELRQSSLGSEVLVRGTVSESNPPLKGDYRAYLECRGKKCEQYYPLGGLVVDLEDGSVLIDNTDATPLAWKEKADPPVTYRYLEGGGPVVLLGTLESLSQPAVGDQPAVTLKAEILFSGAREGFRAQAQRSAILPRILLVTNLVAAVAVAILLLASWPEYG